MFFIGLVCFLCFHSVECVVFLNYCTPSGKLQVQMLEADALLEAGRVYTARHRMKPVTAHTQLETPTPIKFISILGERNSCTNAFQFFVKRYIAFDCIDTPAHKCVASRHWRHHFASAHMDSLSNETLYIHLTRHPYEWIQSMRRNPFWANLHKQKSMHDFISLEWMSLDYINGSNKGVSALVDQFLAQNPPVKSNNTSLPVPGCTASGGQTFPGELMTDRDPLTGQRFPTVMAMRESKLKNWLSVASALPFTHSVSCRDFMLDPDKVLQALVGKYGFKRKNYDPSEGLKMLCVFRFGTCISRDVAALNSAYLSGAYMNAYDAHTLSAVNAWIDWELEAEFGYLPFETVAEAATPYNASTRCPVHGACD